MGFEAVFDVLLDRYSFSQHPRSHDGWESALNSSELLDDRPLRALGREWNEYSISGVDVRTMLNTPISEPNPSFTTVCLQPPGSQQRRAFVQDANNTLRGLYSRHPPTEETPAVTFISIGRSCYVLVVLCDEWEELLHLDQSSERMGIAPPPHIVVAAITFDYSTSISYPPTHQCAPVLHPKSPTERRESGQDLWQATHLTRTEFTSHAESFPPRRGSR
jgi:hypothetical protein